MYHYYYYYCCFPDEESIIQKGYVTCTRIQMQKTRELRYNTRHCGSNASNYTKALKESERTQVITILENMVSHTQE